MQSDQGQRGAGALAAGGAKPIRFSSRDGLRLFARHYEAAQPAGPPVLCLAGLTRNGRDFHDLAVALSQGPRARDVYTLDSRGRGFSEYDRNWRNYSIPVEAQDVIDLATIAGLHGATVVGTSRGGILAMVIAAMQPGILGAVVLNDIGPTIERDGLARIAGYVGRVPLPGSWNEAEKIVASMNRTMFPAVPHEQWMEVARAWFNEKDGRPARGYDPRIGNTLSTASSVAPSLWPQFTALGEIPTLIIRGELSDLLSAATVAEMHARHANSATLTVPGQGHAPLLKDGRSIGAIQRFVTAVEKGEKVASRDFAAEA